jgi:hypothetical protein
MGRARASDLFHVEGGFVEIRDLLGILGRQGDMPDFCHVLLPYAPALPVREPQI